MGEKVVLKIMNKKINPKIDINVELLRIIACLIVIGVHIKANDFIDCVGGGGRFCKGFYSLFTE